MPGGQDAIVLPEDPDDSVQMEIVMEHIHEWFASGDFTDDNVADCARGIVDCLNERRLELLGYFAESDDIPPFVGRHVVERSNKEAS